MKVYLEEGAFAPVREHPTDAGLDIRAKDAQIVPARGTATFYTGVHIQLPPNTAGVFVSKSGLNIHHDITSTGLIDEGYTGAVVVKLHNHGDTAYYVMRGDKISQIVITPVLYEDVEITTEPLPDTPRGSDGFGSTGR